ncbi:MAG: TolC family protein [Bacteroidetes bacterium]|nr:TolC family protein [Bacteroidota bacterium]HET6243192.1 TolC family protein [Bacteroidia bacterium]
MNLIKKNSTIWLSLLLSFTTIISFSQEKWNLKQCIDYALEHNIQVKQANLNIELANVNSWQNRANSLPSVNGNASHSYNFGRTIDPFTNQFADDMIRSNNFSLTGGLNLFSGFQNVNSIKQGQLEYQANKYDSERIKNDISLSIATAYLQILFSEELMQIAINQVDITTQQVKRTTRLVEAGTLARGSLLEVEAQLATEELNLVNSQNQLDMAYLSLRHFLALPLDKELNIVRPILQLPVGDILTASPETIFTYAAKEMPEIKSAQARVRSSDKGVAIAKGGISPRIFVNGALGTGYSGLRQRLIGAEPDGFQTIGYTANTQELVVTPAFNPVFEPIPFNDQINENYNKSIGFFMTIPIFNGLQTRSAVSRAKIARYNAQYNLELAELQLSRTVTQAHADAVAALKKHHATARSMEALKESFKYAEQRFNVGMLNAIEYNNAKNRLVNAESNLLQAKYDYIFKLKVLDFYQGKPLVLE